VSAEYNDDDMVLVLPAWAEEQLRNGSPVPSGPKVVKAYPPNYAVIRAAFPWIRARSNVVFAHGERIYNPSGQVLSPALWAHERVHCARQLESDVANWWKRYISDRDFRLEEEVLAHRAEWQYLVQHGTARERIDVVKRLTLPMYKFGLTEMQALELITNA
jgi:hypothetical protein